MKAMVRRTFLGLGLAAALGLAAGGWQGAPAEHLFVLLPDGVSDSAEVAARAEGILEEVWGLWLPQGVGTAIPEHFFSSLPPGLRPPAEEGPSFGVVMYDDPEGLWQETRRFGIAGTYLVPRYLGLEDLCERLDERFSQAGAPEDWSPLGMVLVHCPQGDCPALLAHELTHALQDYVSMTIPTGSCPVELDREPRLVIEGMARWTEFVLGYGGDFETLVRGPVAIWLTLGGWLDEVPEFLLYEIGASLFQYLSSVLSPPELLALFSSPVRELLGVPEGEFPALFRHLYGTEWEEFLAGWREWVLASPPPPEAELVYEERRLWFGVRTSLLWPLLTEGEREEIRAIRRAIWRGEGTLEGLRRADAILKEAWAEPTPKAMAAIEARIASLRDWARAISGPKASAEVSALWLIRNAEPDHPERYLRDFVEAVNSYLISPAPSPLDVTVP